SGGGGEGDRMGGSGMVIVDDGFEPASTPRQISVADVLITEGDSSTTNAVFTLRLSPASSLPVTVNFATADGTAKAGLDYVAQTGTATFLPGLTSTTVAVPIIGDLLQEDAENFTLQFSNPSDGTLLRAAASCIIQDNDPLPLLSISDVSGLEGDLGVTNFDFVVSLSPASGQTVTVQFTTADGAAKQGQDYLPAGGVLTFAPG